MPLPARALTLLLFLTSAFKLVGSFAPNTRQGAFGQANAVPQQLTPPYTPFNEEPAYKPSDRR
jgi:hypothetical protein